MSSNGRTFERSVLNFSEELKTFLGDSNFQREYENFKFISKKLQEIIGGSQEVVKRIAEFEEKVFKTSGDSVVTINNDDAGSVSRVVDSSGGHSADEHSTVQSTDSQENKKVVNPLSDLIFASDYEELLKKQSGVVSPADQSESEVESKADDHQSTIDHSETVPPSASAASLLSTSVAQPDTDRDQSASDADQNSEPSLATSTIPIPTDVASEEVTSHCSPSDDDNQDVQPANQSGKQLLDDYLETYSGQIDATFTMKNFDLYNLRKGKFDDDNKSKTDKKNENLFPGRVAEKDQKMTDDESNDAASSVILDYHSIGSNSSKPVAKAPSPKPSSSKADVLLSDDENFVLDIDFEKVKASTSKQQSAEQPAGQPAGQSAGQPAEQSAEPAKSESLRALEDDYGDISEGESYCSVRSTRSTRSAASGRSNISKAVKRKQTAPRPIKTRKFKIELVKLPLKLIELASRNAKTAIKEIARFEADVIKENKKRQKMGFTFDDQQIKIPLLTGGCSSSSSGLNYHQNFVESDSESDFQVKPLRQSKKRKAIVFSSDEDNKDRKKKPPRKPSSSEFSSIDEVSSYDGSDSDWSSLSQSSDKKRMPKKPKLKASNVYTSDSDDSGDESDSFGVKSYEKEFLKEVDAPMVGGELVTNVQGADATKQTNKENVKASTSGAASQRRPYRVAESGERKKSGREKKTKRPSAEGTMQNIDSLARKQEETFREIARIKRIKEIQSKFTVFKDLTDLSGSKSVVLEYSEKGDILVQIDPILAKSFKEHQKDGLRFMYWNTVESLQALAKGEPGNGTILAHNPGLGKTFQIISLVHCLFTNNHTKDHFRWVLVLVPVNVLANWHSEINKWIYQNDLSLPMHVHNLENRNMTFEQKTRLFTDWHEIGGILLMGHKAFSSLIENKSPGEPAEFGQLITKVFLDPGPSMVVVDEGHEIKNSKNQLNMALNKIRTKRRIVLSGTPLQNRLEEYYHMCNFVRPFLLGDFAAYKEEFIKLIEAGQHEDSSSYEVKLMKKRIHVLQKYLQFVLHRASYEVLKKELDVRKYEYVVKVRLTDIQDKLYRKYLEICNNKEDKEEDDEFRIKGNRFFQNAKVFCNIYNQPQMLFGGQSGRETWYRELMKTVSEAPLVSLSSKFRLFLLMLQYCETKGEKLIVFSERLQTLDFIQELLQQESATRNNPKNFQRYKGQKKDFQEGTDYLRICGKTPTNERLDCINKFNDTSNTICRLFLLSKEACAHGINLIGANRCIIFETHFNPAKDQQSICRTYRYGQTKDVYVYRFVAHGTAEEVIYAKQVQKQSLINRILDDFQSKRAFKFKEVKAFYEYQPEVSPNRVLKKPEDELLASILENHPDLIVDFHEHDSLLEIVPDHDLTEEEKLQAWHEWESDKQLKEKVQKDNMQKMFLNGVGLGLKTNLTATNAANVQSFATATSQAHLRTRLDESGPTANKATTPTFSSGGQQTPGTSLLNPNQKKSKSIEVGSPAGNNQEGFLLNLLKTPLVTSTTSRNPQTVPRSASNPFGSRTSPKATVAAAAAAQHPLLDKLSPSKLHQTQRTYSSFRPQQTSTNTTEYFSPNHNQQAPFANVAQPSASHQPQANTSQQPSKTANPIPSAANDQTCFSKRDPRLQQHANPNANPNANSAANSAANSSFGTPPPPKNARVNRPLFHPNFHPQSAGQPINQQNINQTQFMPQFVNTNIPNVRMAYGVPPFVGGQPGPNAQMNANRPASAQPNVNFGRPTNVPPNTSRTRNVHSNVNAGGSTNVPTNGPPNAGANRPMNPLNFQRPTILIQVVNDPKEIEEKALSNIKTLFKNYEKTCAPTTGIDLVMILSDRLKNIQVRARQLERQPDSPQKLRESFIIKAEKRLIDEIIAESDQKRLFSVIENSVKIIRPELLRSVPLDVEELD